MDHPGPLECEEGSCSCRGGAGRDRLVAAISPRNAHTPGTHTFMLAPTPARHFVQSHYASSSYVLTSWCSCFTSVSFSSSLTVLPLSSLVQSAFFLLKTLLHLIGLLFPLYSRFPSVSFSESLRFRFIIQLSSPTLTTLKTTTTSTTISTLTHRAGPTPKQAGQSAMPSGGKAYGRQVSGGQRRELGM